MEHNKNLKGLDEKSAYDIDKLN